MRVVVQSPSAEIWASANGEYSITSSKTVIDPFTGDTLTKPIEPPNGRWDFFYPKNQN
jgi:hypothetical protein